MEVFLTIIGGLVTVAIFVAIASFFVSVAAEKLARARDVHLHALQDRARMNIGASLQDASYWFSEDKKTYLAIRMLGEALIRTGSTNVSAVREEWRHKLANGGE